MVWLIINEFGDLIAIVADPKAAETVASALAAHVEASHCSEWHVGDHVPIFHD